MSKYAELAIERVKDQSESLRQITTKASIMLGVAALIASRDIPNPTSAFQTAFLFVLCITWLSCVVLGIFTIVPRTYWEGPDLRKAKTIIDAHSADDADEWLAEAHTMACEHNAKHLARSSNALHWGIISLAVAIACVALIRFF